MGAIANFNGAAAVAPPPIPQKSMKLKRSFPLSLSFKKMEGQDDLAMIGENFDAASIGMRKEDGYESRSGSENLDGAVSGEDQEPGVEGPPRKKYHRHTPQQIQELETFFKDCPHPDEKQRGELSRRLGLESKQIKFWFQNRRTQKKTQLERHENIILKEENERLNAENGFLKHAIGSPSCTTCGGPAVVDEYTLEHQRLKTENARLNDELGRLRLVTERLLGVTSPMSINGINVVNNGGMGIGFGGGVMLPMGLDVGYDRTALIALALTAMAEFMKMAQMENPLWIKSLDGGQDVLNLEEYVRTFPPCIGLKPNGYVTEASRGTAIVMTSSLALVDMMMDAGRWGAMFPFMIERADTIELLNVGTDGTKNNAVQVMNAELKVLSPMVPARHVQFLRFCKQHAEGLWSVVDVSVDSSRDGTGPNLFHTCRRLPSGCLVQDMGNGYSKVIWVEHSEYDESAIHDLYKPLVRSGLAFGAETWLATLQKQCDCLAILLSPNEDPTVLPAVGRQGMGKLAQRMILSFCSGICASTTRKWETLRIGNMANNIMFLTRKNVSEPGEPLGVVLSASTSVWLPVSQLTLFEFLQSDQMRSQWDILSNGIPMQEILRLPKGQVQGNHVSLLRSSAINGNNSSVVILQETWNDATFSLVVYAPIDEPAIDHIMVGGDTSYVAILPSGFAIFPYSAPGQPIGETSIGPMKPDMEGNVGGCLLTVGFQILVNRMPSAVLTMESVGTVNNLISCTINKIKTALNIAGAAGAVEAAK